MEAANIDYQYNGIVGCVLLEDDRFRGVALELKHDRRLRAVFHRSWIVTIVIHSRMATRDVCHLTIIFELPAMVFQHV